MKLKNIFYTLSAALITLTMASCLDAATDSESLGSTQSADEIAANLDIHGVTPGSNMLIITNKNKGIAGMWDYLVGTTTLPVDTVLLPFLGEQTLKFYATCGGGQVVVEKKVTIEKIDHPLDPAWAMLAGATAKGKTWRWDPNPGRGSWGCYGAGGYGWSADVPNWSCSKVGETTSGGITVSADEYITFDLNGGANATLHKADGTIVKGSFSFTIGTTADKAALKPAFRNGTPTGTGWIGTLKLSGVSLPAGYTYYDGKPSSGTYDVAVLSNQELVLIEPDPGAILTDPAWASISTHWCFTSE